ncbi:unnamed protein product [marine sediment metagenome]|uniref:Methyltransferase domain-containing protein n=1 Tax=marine sediment metagenome TaxID=412755 RepID=X1MNQ6_9ZZZZ
MLESCLDYLCCPNCKKNLIINNNKFVCNYCNIEFGISEDIIKMLPRTGEYSDITIKKWDLIYKKQQINNSYYSEFEHYNNFYFKDTYIQLKKEKSFGKNLVYLEIGCGQFFLGQKISNEFKIIIGIDISFEALKIAKKMLDEKFKRQVVESVLSGSVSQVELARKYTISPLLISRYKKE